MKITTIVQKLGCEMYYLGKPVFKDGVRIGSITEVKEVDNHYELTMDVSGIYEEIRKEYSVRYMRERDRNHE